MIPARCVDDALPVTRSGPAVPARTLGEALEAALDGAGRRRAGVSEAPLGPARRAHAVWRA